MKKRIKAPNQKPQKQRFIETARALGCDTDEDAFKAVVRKIAKTPSKKAGKPKRKKAR